MKHGGQRDFIGRMFKIEGPSLRDLVEKSTQLAADMRIGKVVLGAGAAWPMERILNSNRAIKNAPIPDMQRMVLFIILKDLQKVTKNQKLVLRDA